MPIESPNFVQDVKVKHADCALLAVFHEVVSVVPINLPKTRVAPHLTLLAFHLSSLKGHLGSSTLEVQTHGPTRSYSSKLCNVFLVNFHKSTVQMQLILAHAVEALPWVGSECTSKFPNLSTGNLVPCQRQQQLPQTRESPWLR